jgi:hypothetical protein
VTRYRVLSRKQAAGVVAVVAVGGAFVAWLGTEWMAAFSQRMTELAARDPVRAAAEMRAQMRIFAVVNGTVLCALAAFLCWYGVRGIRTKSMPPAGAWVLRERMARTGTKAVRLSQAMVATGVVLVFLAIASSLVIWRIGDQLAQDSAARQHAGSFPAGTSGPD